MGSYAWIPGGYGSVPSSTAVKAGTDIGGRGTLYAGRASFAGDLLPAKISPPLGGALIAHGGAEYTISYYEVGVCNLISIFIYPHMLKVN